MKLLLYFNTQPFLATSPQKWVHLNSSLAQDGSLSKGVITAFNVPVSAIKHIFSYNATGSASCAGGSKAAISTTGAYFNTNNKTETETIKIKKQPKMQTTNAAVINKSKTNLVLNSRDTMFLKIKQRFLRFMLLCMLLTAGSSLFANNITLTNICVSKNIIAGANHANNYAMVSFNLSWDNSWRTSRGLSNWDAAWVFIKYRVGSGAWQHAKLNTTAATHTAPSGSTIVAPLDSTGVFIHRSADGTGTFSLSNVQLRWQYGSNGVLDDANISISVSAIEMVYVPQGSFYVGSGGIESGSFTDGSWTGTAGTTPTIPYQITSENALGIDNAAGKLWGTSTAGNNIIGNAAGDAEATLIAAFPKGYAAFYCMKYEISQEQYVEFLNKLTYTQQVKRTAVAPNRPAGTNALNAANRNGIDIMTPGVSTTTPAVYACNTNNNTTYNEAADGQNIACNFLSWADLAAYLDWAGLRPMTELEYEKACRGPLSPVANEYAWGTSTIAGSAYTLSNPGTSTEAIATNYSTTAGNASYATTDGSIDGPLRVGIFADASGTRVRTGATYYGIMEMSGNLWEHPVTIGNADGRNFTGTHGNGALNATGDADASSWPAAATASGAGYRGGAWYYSAVYLRVSDRYYAADTSSDRYIDVGGRGVRVAP